MHAGQREEALGGAPWPAPRAAAAHLGKVAVERAVVEGQLVAADARLGRRVGALEGHPRPPEAAEVAEAGAGLDARKHLLEAGLHTEEGPGLLHTALAAAVGERSVGELALFAATRASTTPAVLKTGTLKVRQLLAAITESLHRDISFPSVPTFQ